MDRMDREQLFAWLWALDEERPKKALRNLYWRGTATIRQRVEAELDPDGRVHDDRSPSQPIPKDRSMRFATSWRWPARVRTSPAIAASAPGSARVGASSSSDSSRKPNAPSQATISRPAPRRRSCCSTSPRRSAARTASAPTTRSQPSGPSCRRRCRCPGRECLTGSISLSSLYRPRRSSCGGSPRTGGPGRASAAYASRRPRSLPSSRVCSRRGATRKWVGKTISRSNFPGLYERSNALGPRRRGGHRVRPGSPRPQGWPHSRGPG